MRLDPFASVSRKFQEAVERVTFEELTLLIGRSDLDEFRRTVTPARQPYVRHLHIKIAFPKLRHHRERLGKVKYLTSEQRSATSEAVTTQLRELFDILQSWPFVNRGMALTIYA
ncbi:hypothetical protein NPX13_g10002 [Xylaria arbuscula]|uniref:Uncharacterized protein n=1 Tax=Xylaria arbuscula TaxID=114810 RepID=A0A9W8N5G5_9PEZI|nr:hypothetical protein NPX13_g10002 [Xylaria arbuscula]